MPGQILSLSPYLFIADFVLVALHLLGGHARFVDLDREHNLPTWFSGIQLVVLALAARECWRIERERAVRTSPPTAGFAVLAGFFLYLSLDEITVLHEGVLRNAVRDLLPASSLWISILPWQLVFGPLLLAMELLMLALFVTRFGRRLDLLAPGFGGVGCWSGAVLAEALAKPVFMTRGWYRSEVAIEEGLEMVGATLLIVAFARYATAAAAGTTKPLEVGERRRRLALVAGATLGVLLAGAAVVVALSLASSAWLYRHNGELLAKRGKWREAAAAFEEARARAPDDLKTLRGLGRAYHRSGDYERALVIYDAAIALQPSDARLWRAKATMLYRLDRLEEAEAGYRKAIEIAPQDPRAAADHGFALEKLGRLEEASAEYRRALAIDVDQPLARSRLAKLGAKTPSP